MNQAPLRPVSILLVEDNAGDVRLIEDSLKTYKMRNLLHVVEDGDQALAFLRREGDYSDAPRPDLILLDLSLPGKDGREVLAEVKSDDDLRRIPVVVLTGSSAEEDIIRSYEQHANCYITKPIDLDQFSRMVRGIEEFWFAIVKLPPNVSA